MRVRFKEGHFRDLLLRRNISQNGLANKLGISNSYCSQLLSGKRSPSPRLRQKIQEALDADFDVLFEIQTASLL